MADVTTYLYGKRFPNRIFVGGLPADTTAEELAKFFNMFGLVSEGKVILDDSGISKGYGFITFESPEDIQKVYDCGTLFFKGKKINVGPAVKKQVPNMVPEIVLVPSSGCPGNYMPVETGGSPCPSPPCTDVTYFPQHSVPQYIQPPTPPPTMTQTFFQPWTGGCVPTAPAPEQYMGPAPEQFMGAPTLYFVDQFGFWYPSTPQMLPPQQEIMVPNYQPVEICNPEIPRRRGSVSSSDEDSETRHKRYRPKKIIPPRFRKNINQKIEGNNVGRLL